ncbi:DUF6587 family protein [Paraburkholderia adhaesiva]|uniref:DUF6587 family protein n=1 Tax=Paraburkholderia adhaesiva TaxID=2883244 RepID=UPI001F48D940|nr:DUF6587 family protein [Paraburkholderia adhaesiva]
MSAGLVIQYAVIAALVAASLLYTLRKLAPTLAVQRQAALAASLLRPGRGPFAQRVGRALQPRGATGNCADGCGTCGSCGPTPAAEGEKSERPLTFHPPRK